MKIKYEGHQCVHQETGSCINCRTPFRTTRVIGCKKEINKASNYIASKVLEFVATM